MYLEGIDKEEKSINIEASGLLSACIQHEVDHLQGILLLDKVTKMKKSTYLRKLQKHNRKRK